jgi:hypothetical protein
MTARGFALSQDPGRAVSGDVRGLPGRGVLAVGEHDVLATAVFDVPVGIEHMPVCGALDGGACHQLILEEARFQELHQGHDVVMT